MTMSQFVCRVVENRDMSVEKALAFEQCACDSQNQDDDVHVVVGAYDYESMTTSRWNSHIVRFTRYGEQKLRNFAPTT
jgi:hypothetical protein